MGMRRLLGFFIVILVSLAPVAQAQMATLATPQAVEGQCFARIISADTTERYQVRIEKQAEQIRRMRVPALYRTEHIRVEIKPEVTTYRTTPAVYQTVTEQVLIRPAGETVVTIPARYETLSEQVLVEPEKTVWRAGTGLYGRQNNGETAGSQAVNLPNGETLTGEVMCRVVIPAKYRTVTRTVMVTPGRTETRAIPATYRTVTKSVVKTPARVDTIVEPAEYLTIPVKVMVEPERFETQTLPAVYETIEKTRIVPKMEWAEVLCDTNAGATKIAEIQNALGRAGHPTPADGVFGPRTLAAMESFQRAKGLPTGYLTVETVRELGINPYA